MAKNGKYNKFMRAGDNYYSVAETNAGERDYKSAYSNYSRANLFYNMALTYAENNSQVSVIRKKQDNCEGKMNAMLLNKF